MRVDLADLKCVCDEIARVIKSAESNKIAESSAIFLLQGDIGAGKTTLVKAFARYVGISDSVTSPTFSLLHIYSSLNSSLGASFALGGNFGEQQTQKSSFIPKISSKYKTSTAIRRICERSEAINTRICEKNADSATRAKNAESSDICHSNSFSCHSERSEESQNNPSLRADSQNLRGKPPYEKSQNPQRGLPHSHSLARNDEILDSSLRATRYAQNDNKVDCYADSANLLAMTQNTRIAESALDSAQNLTIYHYDLYQKGVDSAIDLGLLDLLGESGIHFVEWGDERLFNIIKNAFENIFIIQITKAKNDRIYEFKSEF